MIVLFAIISLINLLVALLYGGHTAILVARAIPAWKRARRVSEQATEPDRDRVVTIQIPLFNEGAVAAGIIHSVGGIEWKRENFEVQVLDDSTEDEDRRIVDRAVEAVRSKGISIELFRRENRSGFKAGALAEALPFARGEFIAIFDADFRPNPDFLLRLMHRFQNEAVGMVQARWSHLNADANLLTRCQELLIDSHFAVEQVARHDAGWFVNFNGTGGIWRRSCVEDAGGWRSTTLTEDLDLSYRARLAGWRLEYVATVDAPAELPAGMSAFKVQQRRWNRGTTQVMRENIGTVLRSSQESLPARIDASLFLLRPLLHLWLVTIIVLSLPMVVAGLPISVLMGRPVHIVGFVDLLWVSGIASMTVCLVTGATVLGKSWSRALLLVPLTMALGVGICLSNAWAVLQGLRGQPGVFVRTPKGHEGRIDTVEEVTSRAGRVLRSSGSFVQRHFVSPKLALVELAAAVYLLMAYPLSILMSDQFLSASFMLLFAAGLVWVVMSESEWAKQLSQIMPWPSAAA